MSKTEKKRGILYGFAVILTIFVAIEMAVGGSIAYVSRISDYENRSEDRARRVSSYLEESFNLNPDSFEEFQSYFMSHRGEIRIPYGFDGDWRPAQDKYETLLKERYNGATPGKDIPFDQLDDETREAHAIYRFAYWLHMFRSASQAFGLKYAYYIVPSGEPYHMIYVLDMDYEEAWYVNGEKVLYLGYDNTEPIERHRKMWEAWTTGKMPRGYDKYDNEYGKTYAHYYPVYVNDKKMGVIGVETDIEEIRSAVFKDVFRDGLRGTLIMIVTLIITLTIIDIVYVSRITAIERYVRKYTDTGDSRVAESVEESGRLSWFCYGMGTDDEIAFLADQTADMIRTLENRMNNLVRIERKLNETKSMARRDAMTGAYNKAAYQEDISDIESETKDYAIAVIDLNYLKKINDTYGHEKGDIYIRRLYWLARTIFTPHKIYRIGGDEFAIIIAGEGDKDNVLKMVDKFNTYLDQSKIGEALDPWERISAAIGVAFHDPLTDENASTVFKRADEAMYERKKAMKAARSS